MTTASTARYDGSEPERVRAAVAAAAAIGFDEACLPEVGRLLALLARPLHHATIGEAGTGCGVGLAWLAAGAPLSAQLVGVERDGELARQARAVHSGDPRVAVLHGDSSSLVAHGPFDLLFWDGGPGSGKRGEPLLDPRAWLAPGGTLVIDDFAALDQWPPRTADGAVDHAIRDWLEHPSLLSTTVTIADGTPPFAVLIAQRRPTMGFTS